MIETIGALDYLVEEPAPHRFVGHAAVSHLQDPTSNGIFDFNSSLPVNQMKLLEQLAPEEGKVIAGPLAVIL